MVCCCNGRHGTNPDNPQVAMSDQVKTAIFVFLFPVAVLAQSENELNALFCEQESGLASMRHYYDYPEGRSYVILDCETDTHAYEGGKDKSSSMDSIQQALFASYLTGKEPGVVVYDTDSKEGRFEYRIKMACEQAGVSFEFYPD